LQALEQATLVAGNNKVDLPEIERWSRHENKIGEYEKFRKKLMNER